MTIFTSRELAFLASPRREWRRLYRNEVARLLRNEDDFNESRQPTLQAAGDFQCADFQ
jgi:hypothetical protein